MIRKYNEHIAYLDDGDDYDPNEILEVVGIPSGLYFEIKRKSYTNVQEWVNWSEKYQCYIYRDKDYDKVMGLLGLTSPAPTDNNEFIASKIESLGINCSYKITKGGLIVFGNVFIKKGNFEKLPIKFKEVHGDFRINTGFLKTLEGCPEKVDGDFDVSYNQLINLKGGPKVVSGEYDCSHNYIKNLIGSPMECDSFNCSYNDLMTLIYCPSTIINNFNCSQNYILNLKDAPISVGKTFDCSFNKIESLKGLPMDIKRLVTKNNPGSPF